MTKLVILDKAYDLFLAYSWGSVSQGVSGHLYECIEYYHILKKHMKVGILMCKSELTADAIRTAVEDKYDFTEYEVNELLSDVHFFDSPKVLKGNNLLLVDGNFTKLRDIHLLFKNIMAFPCSDRRFATMDNITVFLDKRIYGEGIHKTNYVKKILFSRYKQIEDVKSTANLVYNKKGPRDLGNDIYKELEEQYSGDFLVVTNAEAEGLSNRFIVLEPPIKDLFRQFGTYIYTPIPKKFDCSPRFIAECKWYGKEVVYHNIDYWGIDKGLYYRFLDIQNDFNSIQLKEDDEIIDLVKGIINV
jgi:hypothetical protein